MNSIIGFGKYIFAIPFAVFGILHFMNAGAMAPMAFGISALVYLTGVALIAAAVSIFIGKYDKLAAVLLALMLLILAFVVHAPNGASQFGDVLKNISLAGGALMYAGGFSKDKSLIG